jgi:polyhydroxyalkanoate synthesis regulator phasin
MRRLLKTAAVVVVLGLTAVAVGGAVTSAQDGDGPVGTFLSRVAEKLGISEDTLKGAMQETSVEMLDEAVAEGRLTQEQADQIKERAGEDGLLFPFGGPRRGFGAPFVMPEAAAQALGITQDQLMEQLKDGKTLAEVAEAQGMSVEDFQAALLTQVKAQLDALVADGKLTQEQADSVMQNTKDNIDKIVNSEGRMGGCGGPRGGPGPGFGPPSDVAPGLGPKYSPPSDGAAGSAGASDGTA